MLYETYLDDFGRGVKDLVIDALNEFGKASDDFAAIEQYGDSVTLVSPKVTLRVASGTFRSFRIRYEHQVWSTPEQIRDLVRLHVRNVYLPLRRKRSHH